MTMIQMKLKLVYECDFRKSEASNFVSAMKENDLDMRSGDVIMLKSLNGNQIKFVYPVIEITQSMYGGIKRDRKVYRSLHLRLDGGHWDPLLLAEYATRVGIQLDNKKLYEVAERHLKIVAA